MRFSDLLVEVDQTVQTITDIVTIMAGEDAHSLPLDAIQHELAMQGIDISDDTLFDVIETLVIVDDIKTKWITVSLIAIGVLGLTVSKVGPEIMAMFNGM